MQTVNQQRLTGERALFNSSDLLIKDCTFADGESPLKESRQITIENSSFEWKYPLWYCKDVKVSKTNWLDMARAGVWYTDNIEVSDALIQAPKNFRRCKGLFLKNVTFTNASETLWNCQGVKLENVSVRGDYFAMNSSDMEIDGLKLDGNYSFDGVKNMVIRNSVLLSKDAFWNSENVTVYDSTIAGEYLGWNSKNLKLINCTIRSLQGMCYIENLEMVNCKLVDTTLAFEYSDVNASINSKIDSVLNPLKGSIKAPAIGELFLEKDQINPKDTVIECDSIDEIKDIVSWRE